MIRVRTTKTGSGKTAVQVVNSTHQKTYILKHLGSASTKDDIDRLRHLGNQYIETDEGVSPLFPQLSSLDRRQQVLALMESIVVKPTKHITAYNLLLSWYRHCGFDQLQSEILRDFSTRSQGSRCMLHGKGFLTRKKQISKADILSRNHCH